MRYFHPVTTLLTGAMLLSSTANAEIKISDNVALYGDARFGFYSLDRDDRDGSQDTTNEWRLRIRPGIKATFSDAVVAKLRFAGRYSTDESNKNHAEMFGSIPAGDGLRRGDSTIDELYIDYKASAQTRVRVGRMQTKFELAGVAKKSLDRNDSPNTDITWTDGIYAKQKLSNSWTAHAILQYSPRSGATTVRRSQLNFTDSDSRITYFAALESKKKVGHFVQRGVDITYIPGALRSDDSATGTIDDYLAFVGRAAAQWPIGAGKSKFLLGGELGFAPNTQTKAAMKIGSRGDVGGNAAQLTFNFVDFIPAHSFGLVLARADAGWLLSPDFRNNNTLIEGRYQWKLDKKQKFEARLRKRDEIEKQTAEPEKRTDVDLYIRYTRKF